MKAAAIAFQPLRRLLTGRAPKDCRAVVIVPARNEEATLGACLDALAIQVELQGSPLLRSRFEVLLLLNNCTDRSAEIARGWGAAQPEIALSVIECTLARGKAHAGTARKLLMDTACQRLGGE